jgi:hypothetical protein
MRIASIMTFTFLCLFVAGCSSEPARYPTTGTVTINGEPAAFTHVMFIAMNPKTPTSSGGNAVTDEKGNFTVSNGDNKAPGLMSGDYKVIFTQTLINGKPSLAAGRGKKPDEMAAGQSEGVPKEYLTVDSTPILITAKSGMGPLTFELKGTVSSSGK